MNGEIPVRIVSPMLGPDFPRHRPRDPSNYGHHNMALRPGQWSRKYDRCQNPECGTTSRGHRGHGLCRNCYQNARVRERREATTP